MITRIRELLEIRQLSPTQFADLIGVGRPVISHILSERNKPSLEVVQKIIGAFPEISLPWLLAGTGSMLAVPPADTPPTSAISASLLPNTVATPAPAAITAPFVAPAAVSTSPPRATAALQPNSYPQPPKFRPAAASSYLPTPELAPIPPVPAVASATVKPAVAALPSTALVPEASLAPAVPQEPSLPLLAASAAPVANVTPDATTNVVAPVAESSAVDSNVASPSSNPAAALSFLGEPGKAIRRIVIFYRDGSFSDYLPEGH